MDNSWRASLQPPGSTDLEFPEDLNCSARRRPSIVYVSGRQPELSRSDLVRKLKPQPKDVECQRTSKPGPFPLSKRPDCCPGW